MSTMHFTAAALLLLIHIATARQEPPINDLTGLEPRSTYTTFFAGCYAEGCGCGVPPEILKQTNGKTLPYVALNVQNTGIIDDKLSRPLAEGSPYMGMFYNGRCRFTFEPFLRFGLGGQPFMLRVGFCVCGAVLQVFI